MGIMVISEDPEHVLDDLVNFFVSRISLMDDQLSFLLSDIKLPLINCLIWLWRENWIGGMTIGQCSQDSFHWLTGDPVLPDVWNLDTLSGNGPLSS